MSRDMSGLARPARRRGFFIGAAAMAAALTAANFLVRIPINDWLTWAAFCYPVVYLVCDCVNRFCGAALARRVVAAGFAFGLPLSFVFVYWDSGNVVLAARIAGASGFAYLISQLLDVAVFDRLRRREWWREPLASSALASVVDALIFFSAAFAGSGLPWFTWMLGNLAAKAVMLFLLLPPYRALTARAAPAA